MATTQSPGCICAESPNLASWRLADGISVSWISARVGQRVAADDLGGVAFGAAAAEQADADVVRAFDNMIIGQDEAGPCR